MSRLSRLIGLILLSFFAWDSNVYYFHASLPSLAFWWVTLPVALGFYLTVGFLFALGIVEVRRTTR